MKKLQKSLLSVCTLALLTSACLEITPASRKKKSNYVTNSSPEVNETIGDEKVTMSVVSEGLFKSVAQKSSRSNFIPASSSLARNLLAALPKTTQMAEEIKDSENEPAPQTESEEESLLLGYPFGLVGEQNIFGGVITKVSDKDNETLGTLKLTDLPPLHVRTMIAKFPDGSPALSLIGCMSACDEYSQQQILISLPILGVDQEKKLLMVDLSTIGKELDLVKMMDPKSEYTKLKSVSSATTSFDYSMSTLVFDIKNKMIPVDADADDTTVKTTSFTVRWYLKLNSAFNPAFTSRSPEAGVGFFTTQRSAAPKITRFSATQNGHGVKYYIKNVPQEYRAHFVKAIENWNAEFKNTIGAKLISYEFIEETDARHPLLVAGDIRYNVIEWDLENKASYGGLGPSIANQFTGETLSANILIQGPTVVKLYKAWFGVSEEVRTLRAQGLMKEANKMLKAFNMKTRKMIAQRKQTQFALKLGKHLEMRIHAQRPELEDPIYKGHFELVPAGMNYEDYMAGYFTEMLEHELGHNLGLRHNFKGNLGAIDSGESGSVSRSVMEYLGRPYRHLNVIGLYDKMAIAYGYKGERPSHLNWYCTDEDQASSAETLLTASPECSKSDATSDPFSFWEKRLTRALDMLLEPKSDAAPVWKVNELSSQLGEIVTAFSGYAVSAPKTAQTWTNFFTKGDRPLEKEEVKPYVLTRLKLQLCDEDLTRTISSKATEEAQKLATENLKDLQTFFVGKMAEQKSFTEADLKCE